MSILDFIVSLSKIQGVTPVSFFSRTIPSMKKTGNPYIGVTKLSYVNGMIGNWNYQNAVNRQRGREEKEMDFQSKPRIWGIRVPNSPFVVHKNEFYLEVKVEKSLIPPLYELNGIQIAEDLIEPFLTKKSNSRQELEKEIIVRDYNIKNITQATFMGKTYISDNAFQTAADFAEALGDAELSQKIKEIMES